MPAVGRQTGDVAAQHLDPAVGGEEPTDRVHQRALARAVRADEAHELVRTDPHVDPGDRDPATEAHRDPRRHQPVPRRLGARDARALPHTPRLRHLTAIYPVN